MACKMEDKPAAQYSRRYVILASIMLGSIMGPIDASIVNTTLPSIAEYFGTPLSNAQWVPIVYLLVLSSLLLFFGRLGDIFGYRLLYLSGLAGFISASALCGVSYFLPGIHWLIIFRALQGIAAAMMTAVTFAVITASFPPGERGRSLGINAISISAGLAIGPSLGGFITYAFGWPFVFLINVPVGLAAFFWARKVVPELKGQSGKIDVVGAVTSFVSFLSFLLFVNRLQKEGLDASAVIMLLISAAAAAWFLRAESRSPAPMLNLGLFRSLTFTFSNISAMLNFMSQYVMVFITPFFLQRVLHYEPNDVGLVMTAFPLAVMLVAPFSGLLSDRIGTRPLACLGALICAVALFLMSRLVVTAGAWDVAWRLALFGLGTGIFQSPNNSAAMGASPRPMLGVSSGVLSTVRSVGMVLGITTASYVLSVIVAPAVLQEPSLAGDAAAGFLSGLHYTYLTGAAMTGLAAFTSLVKTR